MITFFDVPHRTHLIPALDGTRIFIRDVAPQTMPKSKTAVCLPGLTRSSLDFAEVAQRLSQRGWRVLAFDLRGRGGSDAADPKTYDMRIEAGDVLHVLGVLGIAQAAFIGTSRGGLITMGLPLVRPDLVTHAVLNDIGPVIERAGLQRLSTYVGEMSTPQDEEEAIRLLQKLFQAQFPQLSRLQWQAFAHRTWRVEGEKWILNYDPALRETSKAFDPNQPLPDLWPLFEGLSTKPVLVVRGELSDILSGGTFQRMIAQPNVQGFTVPQQGHAPLLEGDVASRIVDFL
jgi:pimeloyl-ACP methyl ester carboxylesterase